MQVGGGSPRKRRIRRLTALCLLFLITASGLEAVTGMLRDGKVHHEDLAAASLHCTPGGEHGHEDVAAHAGHHRGGERHEHGTSGDHCTHMHGMALIPSFSFAIPAGVKPTEYSETTHPQPIFSEAFTHPPRV